MSDKNRLAEALEKLCHAGIDIGQIRTGGATSIWIKNAKLTQNRVVVVYLTVSFHPLGTEVTTHGAPIPMQETSEGLAKLILSDIRERAQALKKEVDEMVADLDIAEKVLGKAETDMLEFIQCV